MIIYSVIDLLRYLSMHPLIPFFVYSVIYLFSYLSIPLLVYFVIDLFLYLSIHFYIDLNNIIPSIYLPFYSDFHLFIGLNICLFFFSSIYLFKYLFLYSHIYLFIYLSINSCIHLFIYLSI